MTCSLLVTDFSSVQRRAGYGIVDETEPKRRRSIVSPRRVSDLRRILQAATAHKSGVAPAGSLCNLRAC